MSQPKDINWNKFAVKNEHTTKAFESMCLALFCREHQLSGYDFKANFNQAGVEIHPVQVNGKFVSFQSKYISNGKSSSFYSQLKKSLKKAVDLYKSLQKVIVYTNLSLKPNDDLEEQYGIKLQYIQENNFNELLSKPSNFDIYQKYFGGEDLKYLVAQNLQIDERTFLNSKQFLDLPISCSHLSQKAAEITKANSIIFGHAGTGKSEILKKLYLEAEERFLTAYDKNDDELLVPIYIRLRECIQGDLERKIKEKRAESVLSRNNNYLYIYFLDGLDEIAEEYFGATLNYIKVLNSDKSTNALIFTSRPSTLNYTSLRAEVSCDEFHIDKLENEDKNDYIESHTSLDENELSQLKSIIENNADNFEDIFSLSLLLKTFNELGEEFNQIRLIDLYLNSILSKNDKVFKLNLPQPQRANILKLLSCVAKTMQENKKLQISRSSLSSIIEYYFKKLSYRQVDELIDFLGGLFFDSAHTTNDSIFSFKHRRFMEYFLYYFIRGEFYHNPDILRKLNLLSNKDFMINIFLKEEEAINKKERNLCNYLALAFLMDYLGDSYLASHDKNRNNHIGQYQGNEWFENDAFIEFLCTLTEQELVDLLNNETIHFMEDVTFGFYIKLINNYYKNHHREIRSHIKKISKFKNHSKEFVSIYYLYDYLVIRNIDPLKFYNDKLSSVELDDLHREFESYNTIGSFGSNASPSKINYIIYFFQIVLEEKSEHLESVLSSVTDEHLEVFSYYLLNYKNIHFLYAQSQSRIREIILDKIRFIRHEDRDAEEVRARYLHVSVLFLVLNNENKKLSDDFINSNITYKQRDVQFSKMKQRLSIYQYIALSGNIKSLDSEIQFIASVVESAKSNSESGNRIIDTVLQHAHQYNFLNKYNNLFDASHLISHILLHFDVSLDKAKFFIREAQKYNNCFSVLAILYNIFVSDRILYETLSNQSMLDHLANQIDLRLYEYNERASFYFRLACLYSPYNKIKSKEFLIKGFNQNIFRPNYDKEPLYSWYMPLCIGQAYSNYWISESEAYNHCHSAYEMIDITRSILSRSDYYEDLQELVDKVAPHSPLSKLIPRVEQENHATDGVDDKKFIDLKTSDLTVDKLTEYYQTSPKKSQIDYRSYKTWETLISFELESDSELKILYSVLKPSYIQHYSAIIQDTAVAASMPYIIAILLKNPVTKTKILDYIIANCSAYSFVHLIDAYAIIGNSQMGKKLFTQFYNLCTALLSFKTARDTTSDEYFKLNEVYNSKKEDWTVLERDGGDAIHAVMDAYSIKRKNSDELKSFTEPWMHHFADRNGYREEYEIYYQDDKLLHITFISVDGSRALIPMPRFRNIPPQKPEYTISVGQYKIASFINMKTKDLNHYIKVAGIKIE